MVYRLLLLIVLFLLSISCNDLGIEEEIHGCCDALACNYNPSANVHDDDIDLCEYPNIECENGDLECNESDC